MNKWFARGILSFVGLLAAAFIGWIFRCIYAGAWLFYHGQSVMTQNTEWHISGFIGKGIIVVGSLVIALISISYVCPDWKYIIEAAKPQKYKGPTIF